MNMEDSVKNPEQKNYVLKVQHGEELSLHRLDKISDKESIMRPSYEKAMRALMQIMRQTKRFHTDNMNNLDGSDVYELENLLFGYSGNIIAFAAPRGGGKTATMLSFSQILSKGFRKGGNNSKSDYSIVDNSFLNDTKCEKEEQPEAWMARCCFLPLTPVAPAVLEGEQNILNVVWSRLYRYTERLLLDRGRSDRIKEVQKNEIKRSLQKVLSGIKGIKDPEKKYSGDLASMQDVCDGMSLRRHFYDLVQQILKLAAGDQGISDRYLVIQLDDADSKMQRVYEVLEDVRKYLMIPNLVILMSVDQNCMSDVVFQDNLSFFPDLINIDGERLSQDLSKISNKYIDKLIPPTHMVQLPQLHQIIIQWGDMLRLKYEDQNEKDVYEWIEKDKLELETTILMLIYRKTGILFIKPGHYLHNMVPRTLRGFGQFLTLLDSMTNVPALDFNQYGSVGAYAEAVLRQSEIAAINQRIFTDYFIDSWIKVKITDLEDQKFLQKFADTASPNRIRLAVKYLFKCYGKSFEKNIPTYFVAKELELKDIRNREDLDHLMWEIDRIHRTERDFLLMFAIRTIFTLDSHQHILKQKRDAARAYLKEPKDKKILVFDFSPEYIKVPKNLPIDDKTAKKCKIKNDRYIPIYAGLLTPLLEISRIHSTVNVLAEKETEIMRLQKVIYKMQEWAVMIYANCEATYEVRKSLYRHIKSSDSDSATAIMNSTLSLVSSFNDGKLDRTLLDWEQDGNRYTSVINVLTKLVAKETKKAKTESKKDIPKQGDEKPGKPENDDVDESSAEQ